MALINNMTSAIHSYLEFNYYMKNLYHTRVWHVPVC